MNTASCSENMALSGMKSISFNDLGNSYGVLSLDNTSFLRLKPKVMYRLSRWDKDAIGRYWDLLYGMSGTCKLRFFSGQVDPEMKNTP